MIPCLNFIYKMVDISSSYDWTVYLALLVQRLVTTNKDHGKIMAWSWNRKPGFQYFKIKFWLDNDVLNILCLWPCPKTTPTVHRHLYPTVHRYLYPKGVGGYYWQWADKGHSGSQMRSYAGDTGTKEIVNFAHTEVSCWPAGPLSVQPGISIKDFTA